MSIQNFQRTVWSKKIQHQLETISSLKDHCDFQYQKDSENAKEVKIIGVIRPTIRTYVKGTPNTREAGSDSAMILPLDQYKYFDFEVEDIDQAQSEAGIIEALTQEGTRGFSDAADSYIASLVNADIANLSKCTKTDISGQSDGGIALLEGGFRKLYENNCKVNDSYYLEINPEWYTLLRPEIISLDTNNSDLIKKGFVGKYGNALISIENNLWKGTYDSQAGVTMCMLRTSKAIAYCGQINEVEAYRPQNAFQDAVKALYVFGAKIVRPEQIYVFPIY